MESRLMITCALVVLLYISISSAVPIPKDKSQDKCSSKCDESRNLLNYKKGSVYVYQFKNLITSHIPDGTREQVKIAIDATAQFHIQDKCEIVLIIKDAKMKETVFKDGKQVRDKSFSMLPKLLEKLPLPFGFNDGRITGICNSDDDHRMALNVKKAMISQFQISMEQIVTPTSLTERDVSGDCLTEYQFDKERGDVVHINKMKAIHGCANRKKSYSDLQGQSFDKPMENSQMPLQTGHQKCSLQVSRKGHLVSSSCVEQQVFKPFSGRKSGATVDVEQTLKFVKIIKAGGQKFKMFPNRNTLLMGHNPTGYRDFGQRDEALPEELLNTMCKFIEKEQLSASKSVVNEFPKLVRSLRLSDVKELDRIISTIGKSTCAGKMKEFGMKFLLDALPMVRTDDSAIVMLDGLSSGKRSGYRRSWLFSLATMREPSLRIIEKLAKIGDKLDSPLTVTAIVNTYCKENEFCLEEPTIKTIMKQITDQLQGDCSSKSERILLALRAIGNLGAASDWKIINTCLRNKKIPMGHRISAAQAIRHLRCDHIGWEQVDLMAHYVAASEDPELRITAYLSLMACPQRLKVLDSIIRQLDRETSQQVGSFVWTHLSNLMETSQVFRKSLQNQLRKRGFQPRKYAKRFNLDPRKYSRNFEKSYYNDPLNSGASVEGNLIYSHDSFVPRSATFNMTGGLFGKSISLFELGFRFTNMDDLVAKGMMADFPAQDNAGKTMVHFDVSKFKNPTRPREDPSVDFYLRLFGNELIYKPNIQPSKYAAMMAGMDSRSIIQFINKNPISFSHTRMVMEAVISVPTLSGFPLELSLDVASRVDLTSQMKINPMQGGFTVMHKFKPNGGLGVVGRFRVDAHCTEIGVEFHGTAFTDTSMGVETKVTGSEVTLLIDTPRKQQTLIDMKSRMVLVSERKIREQPDMKTDQKVSKQLCSGKRMEAALGLKVCATAKYAKYAPDNKGPTFPFTGTNEMAIRVTPVSDIKQYKIRGTYIPNQDSVMKVKKFEIELNAVGGSADRQLLLSLNNKSKGGKLDYLLLLRSPKRSIKAQVKGDLQKREIDARLSVDNKDIAKLAVTPKITADKITHVVDLDIAEKKKFVSLTVTSANGLPAEEHDVSLSLTSQTRLSKLEFSSLKKSTSDGAFNYKYSLGSRFGERSADFYFDNTVKPSEKSQFLISHSTGKFGISLKKKSAVRLQYDNSWKMTTTFDKELENTFVTEHTVDFSQKLKPEKYSKFNVDGGKLILQHDFRKDGGTSTLNVQLKANSMQLSSKNRILPKMKPFSLKSENSLKTNKLDVQNAMDLRYNGWKDMEFSGEVKTKGKTYRGSMVNTVKLDEKVFQEIKITGPRTLYHVHSKLTPTDKSFFDHVGIIAWSEKDKYSLKSAITWKLDDMKNLGCANMYELTSEAYKGEKFVGKGTVNSCADFMTPDRKGSIEIQITRDREDKRVLFFLQQDGTTKMRKDDVHIGFGTALTIPGKVDFDVSMNQIYFAKNDDLDLTSNINLNKRTPGKDDEKSYGYKIRFTSKERRGKRELNGKLVVKYVRKIPMFGDEPIQMDSTYKTKIEYEKRGKEVSINQLHSVKSMLWGQSSLEMKTNLKLEGGSIKFDSTHKLKGKLELMKIYEIEGKQEIEGEYAPMKEIKINEESNFKIQVDDKKQKSFNHYTEIESSLDQKENFGEYKLNVDFESNYPLKSFSKKTTGKLEGKTISIDHQLKWDMRGKKDDYQLELTGKREGALLSADGKLSTSFDAVKKAKAASELNFEEMTAKAEGTLNGKTVSLDGKVNVRKSPASSIFQKPDVKLVLNIKTNKEAKMLVKNSKITLQGYYRHKMMKFFELRSSTTYQGQTNPSTMVFAAGFANFQKMGFEYRSRIPTFGAPKYSFLSIGGNSDAVFMIESEKVEIKAFVKNLKIDFLVKVTAKKTDSNGQEIKAKIHLLTPRREIVSKNTALILTFEKSSRMENKGSLIMQKGKASDFDINASFDYRFSLSDFKLITSTDYTFFKKERRARMDIQSIFELRKPKKFEVELIPNRKSADKKLYVLIEHAGTPIWNVNSKVIVSIPQVKSENQGSMRLFVSPDGSKTTKSDLQSDAIIAFDFIITSTGKKLKEIKIQTALSKDNMGKLRVSTDTKKMKKTVEATIDATKFPNLGITLTSDGKKLSMDFTVSGKTGRLVAKKDGKRLGSADVKFVKGKLLKIDVTIQPPKRKAMELRFKQKHAGKSWNWREWTHESGLSLWTAENKNIKFDQNIDFKVANKILDVSFGCKSTLKQLERLEGSVNVNYGSKPSSKLYYTMQASGNTLKINHEMKDWKMFGKLQAPFTNKVLFINANRKRVQFVLSRGPKIPMTIKLENQLSNKLQLLEYIRYQNREIFELKSSMGVVSLKSNIVTFVYQMLSQIEVKALSVPKHIYLTGTLPKYGKLELRFRVIGQNNYQLKMKLGNKFFNVNPKLTLTSLQPFDVALKVKLSSHLPRLQTCTFMYSEKLAKNFMKGDHVSSLTINNKLTYQQKLNYEITKAVVDVKYNMVAGKYRFNLKSNYDVAGMRYTHRIDAGRRGVKRPVASSTADCEPYSFSYKNAKCVVTLYSKTLGKQVIALINTHKSCVATKSVKLAWNDIKKKFFKFSTSTDTCNPLRPVTDFKLYTPIRSFQIIEELDKKTGITSKFSFRVIKGKSDKVAGHVTMLAERQSRSPSEDITTIRILSHLFKQEVRFVSSVKRLMTSDGSKVIDVKSDMFIGLQKTPKLSLIFKMDQKHAAKNDLKLELKGGTRYLNMYTRYDLTNPLKTISIGADAKDWKRSLDILFEKGRRLETTVDTGSSKQTIKMSSERMAQNNGYRNVIELDYPEVNGYLKVISQISKYPLSLLVIAQTDKNNPDNKLVINGRFMNNRNILLEIKRFEKSKITMDTYTQVTLDNQNVITQLKWRPGLIDDIKGYILRELRPTKLTQYLKNRGVGLKEVIDRVLKQIKKPLVMNIKLRQAEQAGLAFASDVDKIKAAASLALKVIKANAQKQKTVRAIFEAVIKTADKVVQYLSSFGGQSSISSLLNQKKINEYISQRYKKLYKQLGAYLKNWNEQLLVVILNKIKADLTQARQGFDQLLKRMTIRAKAWIARRDALLNKIQAGLTGRIQTVTKAVMSSASTKTFLQSIKMISQRIRAVLGKLVPQGVISQLVNQKDIQELQETIAKIRQLMSWSSRYASDPKQSVWRQSYDLLSQGEVKKAFDTYFRPQLTGIRKWDPKQGSIKWQVHLPYNIKSLQSVPLAIYAYTRSRTRGFLTQWRQGTFQLGKVYMRLNEEILRFSPKKLVSRQLPPFASSASILGGQHFVTFDGVNIEHAGHCSYILAHDFLAHSFTVLAEYRKMGKMVMRKYVIVQTPNAAVYLDVKRGITKLKKRGSSRMETVSLPMRHVDITVTRLRDIIRLTGPHGLSLICNARYDVCRIHLSQWSHAKVNGLLGTNDYDSVNDIVGRRPTDTERTFVAHTSYWRVGSCAKTNFAVHQPSDRRSPAYRYCQRQLTYRSSLSRCFSKVPPQGYMQSCLNMYKMKGVKGACSIFYMYKDKCNAMGVRIRLPPACSTCGKKQRSYWYRMRPITPTKTRHFIFIVEDKPCVKQLLPTLKKFVNIMSSRNRKDTYSMLTYGGQGVTKGLSNQILGNRHITSNKDDFNKVLSKLDFKGFGDDSSITASTIQTALNQGDYVSKRSIIVMVTCSGCTSFSREDNYGVMSQMLKRRDIPFHYITQHDFGSFNGKPVIGLDQTRIYGRNGQENRARYSRTLNYRRDTCEALARTSGGSAWSIKALKNESSFGLSKLKSVIRQVGVQTPRKCGCYGGNVIKCQRAAYVY